MEVVFVFAGGEFHGEVARILLVPEGDTAVVFPVPFQVFEDARLRVNLPVDFYAFLSRLLGVEIVHSQFLHFSFFRF